MSNFSTRKSSRVEPIDVCFSLICCAAHLYHRFFTRIGFLPTRRSISLHSRLSCTIEGLSKPSNIALSRLDLFIGVPLPLPRRNSLEPHLNACWVRPPSTMRWVHIPQTFPVPRRSMSVSHRRGRPYQNHHKNKETDDPMIVQRKSSKTGQRAWREQSLPDDSFYYQRREALH